MNPPAADALYFAYGSNLWLPRIRHRVPGVRFVSAAKLHGWSLRWHKTGSDGSAKCDIVPGAESRPGGADEVHGALYRIPADDIPLLDRVEALGVGYDRATVPVVSSGDGSRRIEAWTYVGRPEMIDAALKPFRWYREFVLRGARALGVPDSYLERIRSIAVVDDSDVERSAREAALLTG